MATQPKDFGFGEAEAMVRDSARRLLDEHVSPDKLRALVAPDHEAAYESEVPPSIYDEAVWQKIVELGWTALAVPEEAGGAGMSLVAVVGLVEEVGRHGLPSPLLATLFTTYALRGAETDAARTWLGKIAEGATAALATTPTSGSWDLSETDVVATPRGDGVTLSGEVAFVQDARKAEFFVVSARSDAGVGLYVVPSGAAGLEIRPDRIVDLTRDQASLLLSDVDVPAANVVAAAPAGLAALEAALPALLTIVSADMSGAGEWQLQTTAEYAKVRKQFDRPLGFFQAVKHPIVNMMIAVDEARSLTYNAACAFDVEPDRALRYARMAKSSASDAADFCSGRSVQLHGGIGFTWECDVHLFFKRQLHNQVLFGDAVHQRSKLAELL